MNRWLKYAACVLVGFFLAFASLPSQASGNSNNSPDVEQSQGQHQGQGQGQAQGQRAEGGEATSTNDGNHFLAEGDSFNYDVAANKAFMVTSGCQTGSAADGVEFGLTVISQSPACLLLRSSSDALMFAATLNCTSFKDAVMKGSSGTPDTTCLRLRSQLVNQAVSERQQAVDILTRDAKNGFVKKLWNKIW